MVDSGRSIWRWSAGRDRCHSLPGHQLSVRAAHALLTIHHPHSPEDFQDQDHERRRRSGARGPRPKPMKPVPLTPLEPVPIETGEGQTPWELSSRHWRIWNLPRLMPRRRRWCTSSILGIPTWPRTTGREILREKLQARFGDAGPGFVLPGRPWPTIRYAEAKSLDGQGWRTDGLRLGENDGVVGLGGMSLESFREANPASALAHIFAV